MEPTPRLGPDPFGGSGWLASQTETIEVWVRMLPGGGYETCTNEWVDPIFEANREKLNASANKRFGDGQIVASYPIDFFFKKIVPAKKAGDDAYIKRILNDSDYSKLRTFRGRI